MAAASLQYEHFWGIPVNGIDTNSFQIGGANVLTLANFTNMQIKNGSWKQASFQEYLRKWLSTHAKDATGKMQWKVNFYYFHGTAMYDISSNNYNQRD